MQYDLRYVPFSTAGSYLALSYLDDSREPSTTLRLRTVRGGIDRRDLLTVEPLVQGEPVVGESVYDPTTLVLRAAGHDAADRVVARFDSPSRLRIETAGIGVRLGPVSDSPYDTLVPLSDREWRLLRYGANTTLRIAVEAGSAEAAASWDGLRHTRMTIDAAPGSVLVVTEELVAPRSDPRASIAAASGLPSFEEFLTAGPEAPVELASARELAAYVMWSSIVAPAGLVGRRSMYMSKNWMTNVWSWDHCFNAMALPGLPGLAADQFLTMFDHQAADGRLPDSFNDATRTYTFVKPPIHGWALAHMWDRGMVDANWLEAAYQPLVAWTEWWSRDRVLPGRTLPHYFHGNDSGWDNSTLFASGVPVEAPDLAAFLVLQQETLARMAEALGRPEDAQRWSAEAEATLAALLDQLWQGDRFVARHAVTGEVVESRSLLHLMPIVLGKRLPADVGAALLQRLQDGGFLTEHGLATESTGSDAYESDGYWRGPIWAPSTMLIVDGLRHLGEDDLADTIARSFCQMVDRSGMAENFDALTGEGLRDRAYSWTAGVFLVLASQLARGGDEQEAALDARSVAIS